MVKDVYNSSWEPISGLAYFISFSILLCNEQSRQTREINNGEVEQNTGITQPADTGKRQPGGPVVDLHTRKGWEAELILVVGYIPRWFSCTQTVTRDPSK